MMMCGLQNWKRSISGREEFDERPLLLRYLVVLSRGVKRITIKLYKTSRK